jgi:Lon protease-like protein
VTATARLPLFPLGTVLFPGMLLPLHVFEERYRQLVRDLLAVPEEAREFGVVAIREGREVGADGILALHGVGCVARLRRVEPYEDGRFDVVTSGSRRFQLSALDESRAYLQAEVELLAEPPGAAPDGAAEAVASAFDAYRAALGADVADDRSDDPAALSYLVAATAVLDRTDKQRLLEAPDTTARLRAELVLLRRETALFDLLPSLPAVELTRVPASPN